jgi:hypothetical protein
MLACPVRPRTFLYGYPSTVVPIVASRMHQALIPGPQYTTCGCERFRKTVTDHQAKLVSFSRSSRFPAFAFVHTLLRRLDRCDKAAQILLF